MRRATAIVREGIRQAVRHPLRSLLTAATSAVAIAVTVNVISLVYGLRDDVQRDAARFGRRTVDVVRFPVLQAGLEREPLGDAQRAAVEEALAGLDALVVPRRAVLGSARTDGDPLRVGVVAAPPAYLRSIDVPLAAGRWLAGGDAPHEVCVLDGAVAALLLPGIAPAEVVGRSVTVAGGGRERTCRVVGVLEDPLTHRALFESFDEGRGARALTSSLLSFRNVYLPEGSLPGDEYTGITVTLPDDAAVDEAGRRLREIWPSDPAVALVPRRSVGVLVRRDWMDMLGTGAQTSAFLSNVVWMIIVGVAIVMLSTLNLITIRERFDELAIRRVEGAVKHDIALQVTSEGVLLALLGGLAGLPIGYVGAGLLRDIVDFPFRFEPRYAAVATLVAVLLGLFSSVLPARRAAALQPVTVLTRRRR